MCPERSLNSSSSYRAPVYCSGSPPKRVRETQVVGEAWGDLPLWRCYCECCEAGPCARVRLECEHRQIRARCAKACAPSRQFRRGICIRHPSKTHEVERQNPAQVGQIRLRFRSSERESALGRLQSKCCTTGPSGAVRSSRWTFCQSGQKTSQKRRASSKKKVPNQMCSPRGSTGDPVPLGHHAFQVLQPHSPLGPNRQHSTFPQNRNQLQLLSSSFNRCRGFREVGPSFFVVLRRYDFLPFPKECPFGLRSLHTCIR